jgi:hypothetical protein
MTPPPPPLMKFEPKSNGTFAFFLTIKTEKG